MNRGRKNRHRRQRFVQKEAVHRAHRLQQFFAKQKAAAAAGVYAGGGWALD